MIDPMALLFILVCITLIPLAIISKRNTDRLRFGLSGQFDRILDNYKKIIDPATMAILDIEIRQIGPEIQTPPLGKLSLNNLTLESCRTSRRNGINPLYLYTWADLLHKRIVARATAFHNDFSKDKHNLERDLKVLEDICKQLSDTEKTTYLLCSLWNLMTSKVEDELRTAEKQTENSVNSLSEFKTYLENLQPAKAG